MISWIRICRPGSILGPQQHFIVQKESQMHAMTSKIATSLGIYDIIDKMRVFYLKKLTELENVNGLERFTWQNDHERP